MTGFLLAVKIARLLSSKVKEQYMNNTITKKLIVGSTIFILFFSGCKSGASTEPTPDVNQVMTEVAGTVQAGIALTQAAMPTATATETPTITPTATPAPTTASETRQPTLTMFSLGPVGTSTSGDDLKMIEDVTIPDDTELYPGHEFKKTWKVQNTGATTWTKGYSLLWLDIEPYVGDEISTVVPKMVSSVIYEEVEPTEEFEIDILLTAPSGNGRYKIYFKLRNEKGEVFGDVLWCQIIVNDGTLTLSP